MKSRLLKYYKIQSSSFHAHLEKSLTDMEEEEIHELRLNVKKIRALFSFISFLENDKAGKKGLKKIKKIYRPAGTIRDIQVQHEVVDSFEKRLNISFQNYRDYLLFHEEKAQTELKAAASEFSDKAFNQLKSELDQIIQNYTEEELNQQAGNIFLFKLAEIKKLYSLPTDKDKNLHRIRRILKEARYLLDVFSGEKIEFKGLKVNYERLKEIEKTLGKWHDQVNAEIYLKQFMHASDSTDEGEQLRYNILKKSIRRYKTSLQKRIELAFKYELEV